MATGRKYSNFGPNEFRGVIAFLRKHASIYDVPAIVASQTQCKTAIEALILAHAEPPMDRDENHDEYALRRASTTRWLRQFQRVFTNPAVAERNDLVLALVLLWPDTTWPLSAEGFTDRRNRWSQVIEFTNLFSVPVEILPNRSPYNYDDTKRFRIPNSVMKMKTIVPASVVPYCRSEYLLALDTWWTRYTEAYHAKRRDAEKAERDAEIAQREERARQETAQRERERLAVLRRLFGPVERECRKNLNRATMCSELVGLSDDERTQCRFVCEREAINGIAKECANEWRETAQKCDDVASFANDSQARCREDCQKAAQQGFRESFASATNQCTEEYAKGGSWRPKCDIARPAAATIAVSAVNTAVATCKTECESRGKETVEKTRQREAERRANRERCIERCYDFSLGSCSDKPNSQKLACANGCAFWCGILN